MSPSPSQPTPRRSPRHPVPSEKGIALSTKAAAARSRRPTPTAGNPIPAPAQLPPSTVPPNLPAATSLVAPQTIPLAPSTNSVTDMYQLFDGLDLPSKLALLHQRLPVPPSPIPHKANHRAVSTWALCLDELETAHIANNIPRMQSALLAFLLFPSTVLSSSSRGTITSRCSDWERGLFSTIRDSALAHQNAKRNVAAASSLLKAISTSVVAPAPRAPSEPNFRRAHTLTTKGFLGKAVQALATPAPSAPAPSTRPKLLALHPTTSRPISDSWSPSDMVPDDELIPVSAVLLRNLLRSAPSGKAVGASGMSYEHLKGFLSVPVAFDSLVRFMDRLVNAQLPSECFDLIRGIDLIAVPKDDLGDVRPIALLELLRSLGGKIVASTDSKALGAALAQSGQLAVGIAGGVELAVHACRAIYERHPDVAMLDLDISNMFNACSRDGALLSLKRRSPRSYRFALAFYDKPATIAFRHEGKWDEAFTLSAQGTAQGDPIASMMACCLLADLSDDLDTFLTGRFPTRDWINICIADDFHTFATPPILQAAIEFFTLKCPPDLRFRPVEPYFMRCNSTKTKVVSPQGPSLQIDLTLHMRLRIVSDTKCLGSFIGSDSFVINSCVALVTSWQPLLDLIVLHAQAGHTQDALLYLRSCFCPKISHLLRTTPPALTAQACQHFDSMVKDAFLKISGISALTPSQWAHVNAPFSTGGFNFASASASAHISYAGSWALTLVELSQLERSWPARFRGIFSNLEHESYPSAVHAVAAHAACSSSFSQGLLDRAETAPRKHPSATSTNAPPQQAILPGPAPAFVIGPSTSSHEHLPSFDTFRAKSFPAFSKIVNRMAAESDFKIATDVGLRCTDRRKLDVIRRLGCSAPGSMAWLRAIPCTPSLTIPNSVMCNETRATLGLHSPEELALLSSTCPCRRPNGLPAVPHTGISHVANCSKNAGNRTIRHNTVQDAFLAIAKENGIRAYPETHINPNGSRDRTDVTFHNVLVKPPGIGSRHVSTTLHIDVAVVEPASSSGINMGAHKLRGKYSAATANRKTAHYASLIPVGDLFLPTVFETRGFLDPDARKAVALLAEHVTHSTEMATDMSPQDRDILKGVYIDRFYIHISVALRKACSRCTSAGVNRIFNSSPLLRTESTTAKFVTRAHCLVGAAGRSSRYA